MQKIISSVAVYLLVHGTTLTAQVNLSNFYKDIDDFLGRYVENGQVDYQSIKDDPADLNRLAAKIANINIKNLSHNDERKAFWINAYNLLAIKSVIDQYPVGSPREIAGFFDRIEHPVAGESLQMNAMEQHKLFENYPDPRLHFALVCAARGCPQILKAAYRGNRLEELLNKQVEKTLNNDDYVRVDAGDEKVSISEIFKWYEADFINEERTAIQYINQYRDNKIPEQYSISYITYDWRLNQAQKEFGEDDIFKWDNLQAYTPSTMLTTDQYEIKQFNNLYTQTAFFDDSGSKTDQNSRSTFFTSIINFLYGISPTFNIGFDIFIKSVHLDKESGSPFSVFKFSGGPNNRTEISSLGAKIKFTPFSGIKKLAVQTSFLFPAASDLEGEENGKPFLEHKELQWWTQFFYDRPLGSSFLIYLESGFYYRWDSETSDFLTPVKAILNYYPTAKWTLYLPSEIMPAWKHSGWASYFTQVGVGIKYQVMASLEVETLYTVFPFGKNSGAGQTYNLGIRIIR